MREKQVHISNKYAILKRKKVLGNAAQKIEAYLIWAIDVKAEELPAVEVDVPLLKRLGAWRGQKTSEDMKAVARELLHYEVEYEKPNGDWGLTSLISSAESEEGGKVYRFTMAEALRPFLIQLKENFASFSIHPLLGLGRSSYSHYLYQFAQTQIYRGKQSAFCRITLEDLKSLLGCPDVYPKWAEFQRNVLRPACKEIAENTDLLISYKGERRGHGINKVLFTIERQSYTPVMFNLLGDAINYSAETVSKELSAAFEAIGYEYQWTKNMALVDGWRATYSEADLIEAINKVKDTWNNKKARPKMVNTLVPRFLKTAKERREKQAELVSKGLEQREAEGFAKLKAEQAEREHQEAFKSWAQENPIELEALTKKAQETIGMAIKLPESVLASYWEI